MKTLRFAYPLVLGLLLGGCAVYVPTVPSTPLLTQHQVEITAGLRGINSLEVDAAWAPTAHLLLAGESAFQGSTTETTTNSVTTTYHDSHRQVGLGLGYYQAPTARSAWYWAAVGGVGFASVELHSIDFAAPSAFVPIPLPYVSGFYEARYLRYYGQLYAARPLSPLVTAGASVRGKLVDYTRLTYEGQPLVPTNRFFLEPTLFVRVGHGVVQGEGTLGLSLPTASDRSNPLNPRTAPVSTLVSIGVIFRPDLLGKGGW
ncbi:hypothetical protein E4631_04900 [Hymenobacter sp. UV11]|uniref:hypothetical protein n=1 Tax=Hymenobacter sp. UV11 TaxID=1849735 RepID=UPI00105C5F22|nr:hypothetical protein [Hymenobacter sp. UV11]TDN37294.1 hypothetical protein A8B98_04685 [Hymenobacter sp. UV11]TFZ68330.1 hypothetical protein E4631_04900 [Hymenobacter sp. UV11]